jgi:predicted lipoprotein with Yx(FWY)xxD motif
MPIKLVAACAAALSLSLAAGAGATAQAGAKVTVKPSRYGKVLFDGRGYSLYLFAADRGKRSTCYGACAKAWPPFLTRGKPTAAPGARSRLLGTTRRRDGKLQVTYAGHPLYYYEHDGKGEIKCQNVSEFGGLWLVVSPSGKAVR